MAPMSMHDIKIKSKYGQYIDGKYTFSDQMLDVHNPLTGEVLTQISHGGKAACSHAIDAAFTAFQTWRHLPAITRSELVRALGEAMIEKSNELGRILTLEQGKPLAEAVGEIKYAASFLIWAAEEGKRMYGDVIAANATDKRIIVIRQPIGVTACITPWNFPSAMITRKIGPALAAGNTVVIKPAELTPISAFLIAELAQEVGFPAGVINLITGDSVAISDEMLSNNKVKKLSFTGSTPVGQSIIKRSAQNITKLSLELGGHAPFIVFADADIDAAVKGALASKYRNAGQTCICANRFYIHENVLSEFLDKFTLEVKQMKIGNGLDVGVTVGPMIHEKALEKVQEQVDDAVSKGARIIAGGAKASVEDYKYASFYQPTILTDCTMDMKVFTEETFGPVSPIQTFKTDEEVIEYANASPFGLASYAYTRDIGRVFKVAEGLDYGIVGMNDGGPSLAQVPFGGMKMSGLGREGGKYVMDEYTQLKYISIGL